MNIAKIRWKR